MLLCKYADGMSHVCVCIAMCMHCIAWPCLTLSGMAMAECTGCIPARCRSLTRQQKRPCRKIDATVLRSEEHWLPCWQIPVRATARSLPGFCVRTSILPRLACPQNPGYCAIRKCRGCYANRVQVPSQPRASQRPAVTQVRRRRFCPFF